MEYWEILTSFVETSILHFNVDSLICAYKTLLSTLKPRNFCPKSVFWHVENKIMFGIYVSLTPIIKYFFYYKILWSNTKTESSFFQVDILEIGISCFKTEMNDKRKTVSRVS